VKAAADAKEEVRMSAEAQAAEASLSLPPSLALSSPHKRRSAHRSKLMALTAGSTALMALSTAPSEPPTSTTVLPANAAP